MAVTLTLIGKTPSNTQFALDTFTEHYKCDATADIVLTDAGVQQIGDAHPDYPFMFVTGRPCSETGESASALDLIYTGCLTDDGDGNPILPLFQQSYGTAVQTASSKVPMFGSALATSPVQLQFYARTSTLLFNSYNAVGDVGGAAEPAGDPVIISFTSGDASYSPTSANIDTIIPNFFMLLETDVVTSQEVVSGKFWTNTEVKTIYYGPIVFVVQVDGDVAVALFAQGRGYTLSDALSITGGGGSANMTVTGISSNGAITDFTLTPGATITSTTIVVLDASGGTGTGARFAAVKFM